MNRLLRAALAATFVLAACKIERTPDRLVDNRDPVAEERRAAENELSLRLRALDNAVSRGSTGQALAILAPVSETLVIGPAGGDVLSGEEGVATLLEELVAARPGPIQSRRTRVAVGPDADLAWFAAEYTLAPPDGVEGDTTEMRLSGVYLRHEGDWRLVQAHLSVLAPPLRGDPTVRPPPNPEEPEAR